MLVALAYCRKDQEQAARFAAWVAELGPYPNHSLLVARDVNAQPEIFSTAAGFAKFEEIVISDDVWNKWPESANNALRHIGKHIEFTRPEPWLWIEVDAIPLRAGWLDEIEAEYKASGRPFMGALVQIPGIGRHLTGISVYPGDLSEHAGSVYLCEETAWDVAGSSEILPRAHFTDLILHQWDPSNADPRKDGSAPFASQEDVEARIFAVKPKACIYHADKIGSLIPFLRQRKRGDYDGEKNESETQNEGEGQGRRQDVLAAPQREEIANVVTSKPETTATFNVSGGPLTQAVLDKCAEGLFGPGSWQGGQTPWKSEPDSLAEITALAKRLSEFVVPGNFGRHIHAVRVALAEAGVIVLKNKKRGRPRKQPPRDPSLPPRPRGRPRKVVA